MRILRLYNRLPPEKGGMEQHIKKLSEEQRMQGHEVMVFFNQGNCTDKRDVQILKKINLTKIKPEVVRILIFQVAAIICLIRKKYRFDVIHFHGSWNSVLLTRVFCKLTHAKVACLSIHGILRNNFINKKIFPFLLKKIDVVFVTGFDSYLFIKKISPVKAVFQPSGITPDMFLNQFKNQNFTKKLIVTVANLVKVKNLELVINIAACLQENVFLIIGDGPEKNNLESLIKKNKVKNIQLKGFLTKNEIKNIYENSFLFLLTSFEEGTSTALLEAMASGLPIITSPAGGIDYLIRDSINGFVVKSWRAEDFAEKINLLKKNQLLYHNISENNISKASEFKWEAIAENISQLQRKYQLSKKSNS